MSTPTADVPCGSRRTGRLGGADTPPPPPSPALVGGRLAAAFVVVLAAFVGAGLLVRHPLDGSVGAFDRRVERELLEGRTETWNTLTGWATWLSDTVPVAVMWIALVVFTIVWTRRWVAPVAVMAVIGGEKLSYLLASVVVDRPRPDIPPLGQVHATTSFPSGHTASAVSVYGCMILLVVWSGHLRSRGAKLAAGVGLLVTTVVVAFARMYRGHHYPSDVVAGAALGVCWLVIGWVVVLRDRPFERGGHRQPASSPS